MRLQRVHMRVQCIKPPFRKPQTRWGVSIYHEAKEGEKSDKFCFINTFSYRCRRVKNDDFFSLQFCPSLFPNVLKTHTHTHTHANCTETCTASWQGTHKKNFLRCNKLSECFKNHVCNRWKLMKLLHVCNVCNKLMKHVMCVINSWNHVCKNKVMKLLHTISSSSCNKLSPLEVHVS